MRTHISLLVSTWGVSDMREVCLCELAGIELLSCVIGMYNAGFYAVG